MQFNIHADPADTLCIDDCHFLRQGFKKTFRGPHAAIGDLQIVLRSTMTKNSSKVVKLWPLSHFLRSFFGSQGGDSSKCDP